MAELDVEALKQHMSGSEEDCLIWAGYQNAIIAALEDRDRLRAAAEAILDDYWKLRRMAEPGFETLIVRPERINELRAALERRDG